MSCINCGISTIHKAHMYEKDVELCDTCQILYANGHPFWGGDRTVWDKVHNAVKLKVAQGIPSCWFSGW